jgi:hypothetical protein
MLSCNQTWLVSKRLGQQRGDKGAEAGGLSPSGQDGTPAVSAPLPAKKTVMKLDELVNDTDMLLIARTGTLLILVGVFTLTNRILGLDLVWSILATLVALGLWWQTDWVWKLGARRLHEEQRAIADGHVARSAPEAVPQGECREGLAQQRVRRIA